jgi:hypothetical protein
MPGQQAAADSLRVVLDSVFADPIYDWAERPALLGWLSRGWQWLTRTLQSFQDNNPDMFRWFVTGLIVALGLIVLHAAWVVFRTTRAASASDARATVAKLPAPRTEVWFRAHASELAAAGHFPEALMAAFHALVLDLDRQGMVRYHPSKTPREYVGDQRLAPDDRHRLDSLVAALYGHVFGHEPCNEAEYRSWMADASERWHAAPA